MMEKLRIVAFVAVLALMLYFVSGCMGPRMDPFIEDMRTDQAHEMCKDYTWDQYTTKFRVGWPSIQDVCTALQMCAINPYCILTMPSWYGR